MPPSAETIGALAAALAKAQAELTNPEKSLTATLPAGSPGEADRTFRYAPLASGLDIVRKCLGRHEIAVVQTTAIDQEAGLVRLTTMLAHASGEWLSSDWPVCAIAETASPHRMGAALTYARRYALFAMVGIAGEDDMDAPDLGTPIPEPNQILGVDQQAQRKPATHPILDAEQSAKLRDELIAQIEQLASADDAAEWARRNIAAKNTLTATDANTVESGFQARLIALDRDQLDSTPAADDQGRPNLTGESETPGVSGNSSALGRHNSRPVVQKGIRLRDKEHRKFVAAQPCVVCGRAPCDPHHLRFAQPRALGRKVSDEFTVPLCRLHHRELHRKGDEAAWWQAMKIDPMPLALRLWQHSQLLR